MVQTPETALVEANDLPAPRDLALNIDPFKRAELMASSAVTIPKHLQGNVGDCLAIILQANRWGLDEYGVAQKTHLVNGTLGYEAQLVIAVLKSSNAITGHIRFEDEGEGQNLKVRCGAVLRGDTDMTWGHWIAIKDQTVKNSPLWKTDPSQQLKYLAAKKWARLYCPDSILGLYTPDELADRPPIEKDITPATPSKALQQKLHEDAAPVTEVDTTDVDPISGKKISEAAMHYLDSVCSQMAEADTAIADKLEADAIKKLRELPSLLATVRSARADAGV